MRTLIVIMLVIAILWIPNSAFAAFQMNFHIDRQQDGIINGELRYDNEVVWRLRIISDGAQPVLSSGSHKGISLIPGIENGFMLLKISHD